MSNVPETILKKRRRNEKIAAQRSHMAHTNKMHTKKKRQKMFKSAEKYVREYRTMENDMIRFRRTAKKHGNYFLEPEGRLAVVIRIRGINGVAPKVRKILQLLRLRQVNAAVFVKLNKATMNMLRLVEPYIAYGYPNLKNV